MKEALCVSFLTKGVWLQGTPLDGGGGAPVPVSLSSGGAASVDVGGRRGCGFCLSVSAKEA